MFKVLISMLAIIILIATGCGAKVGPEARSVSITISATGRTDSSGKVEHKVTLKNNSDKTLVRGSYHIRSVDISGTGLGFDAVYPKDVRPGGTRIADVWLKRPPTSRVTGEWISAKFK